MPNMVGGSQTHPAYMPQKLGENEDLIGEIHWTIATNPINRQVEYRGEYLNGEVIWRASPPSNKMKTAMERRQAT